MKKNIINIVDLYTVVASDQCCLAYLYKRVVILHGISS